MKCCCSRTRRRSPSSDQQLNFRTFKRRRTCLRCVSRRDYLDLEYSVFFSGTVVVAAPAAQGTGVPASTEDARGVESPFLGRRSGEASKRHMGPTTLKSTETFSA